MGHYDEFEGWVEDDEEPVQKLAFWHPLQPVAQTKHQSLPQTKHQTKHQGKSAGYRFSAENRVLGGKRLAEKLGKEKLREKAQKMAQARWGEKKS